MSVPGSASPLFLATAAAADVAAFQVDRSLRFNSIDDTYLFLDPSGHGNRKVFTFSFWVKRATLGTSQLVLYIRSGPGNTGRIRFDASDRLEVESEISSSAVAKKVTTAKFRDVSAWQHFVIKFDAVNTNCDIYHNGVELTDFDTNTEPTNVDHYFGGDYSHYLGGFADTESVDGYLAEVHYIDGSALDESRFGEFDSNSVWQPKQYSGTYGTNGFYLKFADNSSNAALGTDSSGNSNTWTVNNLTATANSNWISSTSGDEDLYEPATYGYWTDAFDGLTTTGPYIYNDTATVTFSQPISGTIEVYTQLPGTYRDNPTVFTLSDSSTHSKSTVAAEWFSLGSRTNITSLQVYAPDPGAYVRAIRVNNVILQNETESVIDSLIDTPTNYTPDSGNAGGNYCTLNPLDRNTNVNLSNGNLDFEDDTSNYGVRSTFFLSSGKWYWEVTHTSGTGSGNFTAGIAKADWDLGYVSGTNSFGYGSQGIFYPSNSGATATAASKDDVVGFALDADAGTLEVYINGTSLGAAADANWGNIGDGPWSPAFGTGAGKTCSVNFGQRSFEQTPPTGYVSICAENLSESAYASIPDGSKQFDIDLWSGDGTDPRTRTLSFGPDLVWIKTRNQTNWHHLTDSVRGAPNKLYSNDDSAEDTAPIYGQIDSLNSDGFTLGGGTDSSNPLSDSNQSGTNYVAWAWNAGTASAASNTDGNITSSVKVNQSAGFSIVKYSASTQASASVGHGLNAVPTFIIAKSRTVESNWYVWLPVLDNAGKINQTLYLNTTDSKTNVTEAWGHSSQMTTSTFGVHPTSGNATNNGDMVAYVFTPIEGFSAFGSYTSTGNNNFIYTGFRPAFIICKKVVNSADSSYEGWIMFDSARGSYNINEESLFANSNQSEKKRGNGGAINANFGVDLLSNGFAFKSNQTEYNRNDSSEYIYAAFAEHPFKTARAR